VPDLSAYMAPAEFAALPSAAHHAVWAAYAEKRIDAIGPPRSPGDPRRYNRAQVLELLRETAVTRG
jgi:hypothetical protein